MLNKIMPTALRRNNKEKTNITRKRYINMNRYKSKESKYNERNLQNNKRRCFVNKHN